MTHSILTFISHYGYLAVFVLMLLESACIPIPSEVIMLFGGALATGAIAGGGHPQLIGIVVAGVLGNVAGSYIAWAVGKYAGQAAIHRWGRKIGIREHEIDRSVAWFERHGPIAVLVGRVIPVIRTFISLPAGFADMPAIRFGIYTTLGCIPWTAALGIAGYALGKNWQNVANAFHGPTYAIAGIVVIALVAGVIVVRRRRREADAAEAAAGAGNAGGARDVPGAPGQPGSAGYSGFTGQPGQPGYPGQPGQPGQAGRPGPAPSQTGGWGPGNAPQPTGGRPDGPGPASSPWDPDSRQYR